LISGFTSVFGHENDFIVLPPGIMRVMRLIPPEVMSEHREIAVKPPNVQYVIWQQAYLSPSELSAALSWPDYSFEYT